MSPRLLIGLLFSLWLLAGAADSQAQEWGVLLGLRYDAPIEKPLPYYAGSADSLSHAAYRTVLFSPTDSAFTVSPVAEGLLIPRGSRFWQVDTKRSIYNSWVEDFVWAAPEGQSPTLAGIQPFNGEYCEGHRAQTVLYAGPRYLSLNQRSAGYCQDAAHPWLFNTLAVVPLDSTTHTGLGIDDVLGAEAYEAFEEAAEAFFEQLNEDGRARYIPIPDAANWGLHRQQGRWNVFGRLDSAEEIDRTPLADLPLDINVPPAFAGPGPPVDWRRITAFAPNAQDAWLAPNGAWLLLLRPTQLSVHPVTGGTIGRAVLTHPVPASTRIVMARWATTSQLSAWKQRFLQQAHSETLPP